MMFLIKHLLVCYSTLLCPFQTLTTGYSYSIFRSYQLNHISLSLRGPFCGCQSHDITNSRTIHTKGSQAFCKAVSRPSTMILFELQNQYTHWIHGGFFFFINPGRQTGVFSSTWEPEIEQVVKDLVSETDLVKVSF